MFGEVKFQDRRTFKVGWRRLARRVIACGVSLMIFVTVELSAKDHNGSLPNFTEILRRHRHFAPEFDRWRQLFARHVTELTRVIKAFPLAHSLDEASLRRVLTDPISSCDSVVGSAVFRPWTNRWTGVWCNGVRQYHIWDSTRSIDGQWIQTVTLSETEFVQRPESEEMQRRGRADVGINVFSREDGITGWVSKVQNGRLEMPHIGYRINDTTLVWICQIKSPEKVFTRSNRWLVFLEITEPASRPPVYRIYGQTVQIDAEGVLTRQRGKSHFGTYYAQSVGS